MKHIKSEYFFVGLLLMVINSTVWSMDKNNVPQLNNDMMRYQLGRAILQGDSKRVWQLIKLMKAEDIYVNKPIYQLYRCNTHPTPFRLAVLVQWFGLAQALLQSLRFPARVDERDSHGATALHVMCAHQDTIEQIKFLLGSGADIEAETIHGERPLHIAAVRNNIAVVSLLINAGAQINAQGGIVGPPLYEAVRAMMIGSIELLLAHGANKDIKSTFYGLTPLEYVQSMGRVQGHWPDVQQILCLLGEDKEMIHSRKQKKYKHRTW